jgi:hypothetical protein
VAFVPKIDCNGDTIISEGRGYFMSLNILHLDFDVRAEFTTRYDAHPSDRRMSAVALCHCCIKATDGS